MYSRSRLLFCTILIILFHTIIISANSSIEGFIKDAVTDEPLIGANVILAGTSMGSASDLEGKYVIKNVPPGSYSVRATYIGYESETIEIVLKENDRLIQNFSLKVKGIEGETVVITAQASGQSQAINQQLASNQIINVVSAAKIQELPDANAAESVGRLPGVTVLRSGGEGNAVVIRGLQPKYNKVLLDGVQMSSSDPDDRGIDLSTVSSNMLNGIEVSKSITADMDADIIGGTVNFTLRDAEASGSAVPLFDLLVQGSYNSLSNVYNKYNNYKYVLSAENRYFENKLGVFAQFNMERKNLTSNELSAAYTHAGVSTSEYYTAGLGLLFIPRDRKRYNGAVVIDYKLPEGKIKLSNFLSSGSSDITNRYEFFDIAQFTQNSHVYQLSHTNSKLNIITNAVDYEQQIPIFQMNAKLSHTYSEIENPGDWTVNFLQTAAGLGGFNNVSDVNPEDIPKAANNIFDQAIINGIATSNSFSRERALTGSLDFKTNINFSNYLNADIKFGGKYRYQKKSYDYDLYNGGGLQFGDAAYVNDLIINHFNLPVERYKISLPYFADPKFSYGEFLDGKYNMVGALDYGKLNDLVNLIKRHTADIAAYPGAAQVYGHNNFSSNSNDFSGEENLSAFYVMSVINIGPEITIIPGVRYQNLKTTYKGIHGIQNRLAFLEYNHYDTTVTKNHPDWLPSVSLRYKPVPWFDVRLSYSKTLSYPDFISIVPRNDVDGNNGVISWNNFDLVPQRSTNYDIYLSFYENTIGLLTVGAFYKRINDLIYGWSFYASGQNILNYYPPRFAPKTAPAGPYLVNTYINNSERADDYGMELDWQTHFWYLPGPLSGLVFNINYTHIFSEAKYPFTLIRQEGRKTVYVDTTFTARLLNQPDDILNMSLGYDYKDFSIRVSMLYQTDVFTGADFWPQLRSNTSAYRRWDLAVKQKLPWFGLQVFGNLNNVNGAKDVSVIQGGGVPLSEQQYGSSFDLGLRLSF